MINNACLRLSYYMINFVRYIAPKPIYRRYFLKRIRKISEEVKVEADKRVDYYLNLPEGSTLNAGTCAKVGDFKFPFFKKRRLSRYFFDLYKFICLFDPRLCFSYTFGDVVEETQEPSFVKTRPITSSTTNSVLFKLDFLRHFFFVDDKMEFQEKEDKLLLRNVVPPGSKRARFVEMYFNHPMCDIGRTNKIENFHPEYEIPFMSINDQLRYKFICCIEGNDVATNLKWVMSSNSLAVMPRPKIESWFMEGKLIGDYHYVEIKDDYSDLEEKLNYYLAHTEEAKAIIKHAHEYVKLFRNDLVEEYVLYTTAKRYFEKLGQ